MRTAKDVRNRVAKLAEERLALGSLALGAADRAGASASPDSGRRTICGAALPISAGRMAAARYGSLVRPLGSTGGKKGADMPVRVESTSQRSASFPRFGSRIEVGLRHEVGDGQRSTQRL